MARHNVIISGKNCNKHNYSLSDWQALSPTTHDVGSTVHEGWPEPKQIIAWAKTLLE